MPEQKPAISTKACRYITPQNYIGILVEIQTEDLDSERW